MFTILATAVAAIKTVNAEKLRTLRDEPSTIMKCVVIRAGHPNASAFPDRASLSELRKTKTGFDV